MKKQRRTETKKEKKKKKKIRIGTKQGKARFDFKGGHCCSCLFFPKTSFSRRAMSIDLVCGRSAWAQQRRYYHETRL